MAGRAGFTMVEVVVVMALLAILVGLAAVNIIGSQRQIVSDSAVNMLIADLRSQQIKSMMGDDDGGSTAQSYGVLFEANSYTLFSGSSYSPSNPTNFQVQVEGLSLSSTFPSNTLIFAKASGEVSGYNASQDTITFTNSVGDQTVVEVNLYGVANEL
ncbi:MAG TPA: type II secretion system protein [Candidatus Saccharimonadales bacterium]|nr:type II secretion system protein [Candidatus Saccharimonadales bacterium]